MGRSLWSQRRGKGSPTFQAKLFGTRSSYSAPDAVERQEIVWGEVEELYKESGRNSIIAHIRLGSGKEQFVVAAEGLAVGRKIQQGSQAGIEIGNVLFLKGIPEGCPIFNIEKTPGDGGKLARSTGTYGFIVTKDQRRAFVRLSSGKTIELPLESRATIGNVAGGGRKEKPFVKAGNRFYALKAKKIKYPTVRGVAMNAVDHPFGGAQHHPGKSKSTARNAPPGRKVGAIASSRTGRKKK